MTESEERTERVELAIDELAGLNALRNVNLASVEGLLRACEIRVLVPGEVLLSLGQANRRMYMILSGRLSVHLEAPPSEAVAFLAAGETVGELSVMDASPASAHVIAAEGTRLLAVEEESFWQLVNESHDFAINLLLSLAQRLRANNSTVSTNIRLQREYKRNAMIDGLTSLYNRRWLDDALPRMMTRYARNTQPLSVLMIDVDHFKRLNDTYGHPAGDKVLQAVAKALVNHVRPTDLVARYGGEEFIVILPGTDGAGARMAADRLREAIGEQELGHQGDNPLPRVTVSIGGATLGDTHTPSTLVTTADAALYQSKRDGRNRVTIL